MCAGFSEAKQKVVASELSEPLEYIGHVVSIYAP
jgi:hypothetical protein